MYYAKSNQDDRETPVFVKVEDVIEYIAEFDNDEGTLHEWECFTLEPVPAQWVCMHDFCNNFVNWPDTYCVGCAY